LNISDLTFPNQKYKLILTRLVEYFGTYPGVYAIVLTGSLARGKAIEGSCIDLFVFFHRKHLGDLASTVTSRAKAYSQMKGHICYYDGEVEGGIEFGNIRVDLGFTDGDFKGSEENSFDITRDEFETTIGNLLVYSVSLYQKGKKFQRLKMKYLPFYYDRLRIIRLKGTSEEFSYKIWKTRWLAGRGEYFAALETFLESQRIFLQHLFIKKRKYPIDYTKWLKYQCVEILAKPRLYQELVSTVEGIELTKTCIIEKSNMLEELFKRY
jgi:hypothetical protein